MTKLTVLTSNQKMVHMNSIYRHDEIDSAVESIKQQLHELLDKDVAQDAYNKRYKLTPDDIVQDFNGDMLYIAMAIKDVYNEDIAPLCGIDADDIQALEDGLVKPSQAQINRLAKVIHFGLPNFYIQEHKIDRKHEFTWMGEPGAYERWLTG